MKTARIWITGAGRGIGRETALRFADRGATVYLSSRSAEEIDDVARLCRERGGRATALPLDVRSPEAVVETAARIEEEGGACDVLIPCAGVGSFAPVAETDPNEWNRMLAVNLTGPFLCARAVLPGMIHRGSGRILFVSSIASRITLAGAAAYSASKAGLGALANSLREELRPTGVRITLLIPGAVASTFWDTVESDLDRRRMIPTDRVADELVRLAEERPGATTEELTLLPPEGIL